MKRPSCVWYGCPDPGALPITMPDGAKRGICAKHNNVLTIIFRGTSRDEHGTKAVESERKQEEREGEQ